MSLQWRVVKKLGCPDQVMFWDNSEGYGTMKLIDCWKHDRANSLGESDTIPYRKDKTKVQKQGLFSWVKSTSKVQKIIMT